MTSRIIFTPPITFEPNDPDKLRDIPSRLIEEVYSEVNTYSSEQKLKLGALYHASARDEKDPTRITLDHVDDTTDEGKAAVREASVIVLGGINHEHITIGTPAANYFRLKNILQAPEDLEYPVNGDTPKALKTLPADLAETKLLVFNPQLHRDARVADAYTWNPDKKYSSFEMRNLGEKIWKAKFLDDNGELLPPEQIKPFCLYTFSFGARMSFMLENDLRERLSEKILHATRDTDADVSTTKFVQSYFDRIKRVCIGSSVDLKNVRADLPTIETIHVLRQNDRGMAFEQGFCDNYITDTCDTVPNRWFPNGEAYASIDLRDYYPHSNGQQLILLNHALTSETNPAGERCHGISEYAHDLRHLNAEDRAKMLEFMTFGSHERGTPRTMMEGAPTLQQKPRTAPSNAAG